ncbi:MAG TPA: MarR family transcriptional regulator, partial [Rhodothermales bacterium]|nr:MarR family transcriptional regulator [Rhodothermales bacterium]
LLGAAEAQRERLEEALKAVGLSRAKMEVLHQLVQAGEPLPLRVLAEGQHCVPSNMTTLVDRLEAEGLVQRVAAPDDRRSVRAALTPLGRERAAASMRVFAEVKAAFDAAVPPGERAALTRLLTALSAT